jgi:hypothetical protein
MFKPRDKQTSFFEATYFCEKLVPVDSFYRKFRELVWPIIEDEQFAAMYCPDNGRPGGQCPPYIRLKAGCASLSRPTRNGS